MLVCCIHLRKIKSTCKYKNNVFFFGWLLERIKAQPILSLFFPQHRNILLAQQNWKLLPFSRLFVLIQKKNVFFFQLFLLLPFFYCSLLLLFRHYWVANMKLRETQTYYVTYSKIRHVFNNEPRFLFTQYL